MTIFDHTLFLILVAIIGNMTFLISRLEMLMVFGMNVSYVCRLLQHLVNDSVWKKLLLIPMQSYDFVPKYVAPSSTYPFNSCQQNSNKSIQ